MNPLSHGGIPLRMEVAAKVGRPVPRPSLGAVGTPHPNDFRASPLRTLRLRRSQAGSATLVVLVLMLLMVGLILANARTLSVLKREIQLIEQHQTAKPQP